MKTINLFITNLAILCSLFISFSVCAQQRSTGNVRPSYHLWASDRARVISFNSDRSNDLNENFYVVYGGNARNWDWTQNIKFEVQREGAIGARGGMFTDIANLYLVGNWDNRGREDIIFGFGSNVRTEVNEKMRLTHRGRLGIGTKRPKKELHVNGDIYARGHTYFYASKGDGRSGTAYIQARDNSGRSSIALQLRSQNNGNAIDALRINPDGTIGNIKVAGTSEFLGFTRFSDTTEFSKITTFIDDMTLEKNISVAGDIFSLGTLDIKEEINFSNVQKTQQVTINKGVDFKLTNIADSHFSVKNAFGTNAFYVKTNGKIGFGAINPANITEQIHVAGRVKASGFIADASSFPDYVFAKEYRLMPLSEVKKYTVANHSLPGMPTEKEVVANGLDVKKVITVSVEKIEELYLHAIKQEELLKKQQEENTSMKQIIVRLQEKLTALEQKINQR